jgi:membrane protease YdiL (CAAX protease family)
MNTNTSFFERYSLPIYLILTLLISLAIPLFLSLPPEVAPLMIAIIPALMAIILTALTVGRKGVGALLKKRFQWQVGSKWYLIALGLALVLRLTMSLLALLFGWIPVMQVRLWSPAEFMIIGSFILIGGAMEELGWRGYALPKLLANRSVLFSALFSGVIWGVLHLGLNLPGQMNAGAHWLPTILQLIGLSLILTWLFVRTGGSIVMPILFHAGQNLLVIVNGGITLTQQLWLLTIVTLPMAAILMVFFGSNLQPVPTEQQTVVETG